MLRTGKLEAYDRGAVAALWQSGGGPNASPITCTVDGKQYVAIVTGAGDPLAFGLPQVTPELVLPSVNSSSVVVFALPEE